MISIYKELIKKYINILTKENISNFARTKNIILTDQEAKIIYDFIKTYYNELLEKNIYVFKYLKLKLNPNIYNKAIELYEEYSNKYL